MGKIVFLHGSYFRENFGDFLLLKRVFDEIYKKFNNVDVVFPFCSDLVLKQFGGRVRRANPLDFIKVKLIIFGGGGYLGEPPAGIAKWSMNFIWRHFFLAFLSIIFRKPLVIIGAGAGPISKRWLKPFVRIIFNKANKIILRDIESVYFSKCLVKDPSKVSLGTDLAQDLYFLKNYSKTSHILLPKRFIAVHIGISLPEFVEEFLSKKLLNYCQSGYNLVFFADSPGHNDCLKLKKFPFSNVHENLSCSTFVYLYKNPFDVLNIIEKSDGVITGKLHVGIVSCSFGKPVLSFPIHHKTPRYFRHISRQDYCIESFDDFQSDQRKIEFFFEQCLNEKTNFINEEITKLHEQCMKEIIDSISRL